MDTNAPVRMLTAACADEALAVAVVHVAQNATADHGRELARRTIVWRRNDLAAW